MKNSNMKTVQILLSTYNGEKYLDEQIESLIIQEGVNAKILVRDDGSTDTTILKLKTWKTKGVLDWYQGENVGPARSFMDLISNAPKADYYAFCDQDDVWDKDKLACAVKIMEQSRKNEIALYFSRNRLVDENLNLIGLSEDNPSHTLGGLLIGSHAIGCTMVLSPKLISLLQKYTPKYHTLHDAWAIKVCSAVGGGIYFDSKPHMHYRQHNNNVIGAGKSNFYRYKRLINNSLKAKRRKSQIAEELLKGYVELIPIKNKEIIEQVSNYRESFSKKIKLIKNQEIRRDKKSDNFLFVLSVILGIF